MTKPAPSGHFSSLSHLGILSSFGFRHSSFSPGILWIRFLTAPAYARKVKCTPFACGIAFCRLKANAGPSMNSATASATRQFEFDRDTFAFANELVWEYRLDAASQKMVSRRNVPPPTYAHRCFVLARSARQFLYHARFDAARPVADEEACRGIAREVVSRSPRRVSSEAGRVVVPGYDSLRSFSQAREGALKGVCGGAWQSYVLRSHWRMILPVSRRHQERMAGQLVRSVPIRRAAIVHLFRFPALSINHGIVLYDTAETATGLRFAAYDPNRPGQPGELSYSRADRTFYFPRNHYWAGGAVNVVETYCGWLY
jgi:hypothetical protein